MRCVRSCKLAPPYRLLARMIEDDSHPRYGRMLSDDPEGFVQNMGANLDVAQSRWPLAFCTFLVEEAARQRVAAEEGGKSAARNGSPRPAPPTLEAAVRTLAILKTNAFGIYDAQADGLSNVGLGLFPLLGRANHECDPSAVWTFERTCVVLRALRPLRSGEPVTISYVLSRDPPSARQAKLRDSYRFDCVCARCVREQPRAKELHAMASEFRETRNALEAAGKLVEAHTPAVRRCAHLLATLTPSDCSHPESAVCWVRLAIMLNSIGSALCREEATGCLRRAKTMLMTSLGSRHHAVTTLEAMQRTLAS